MSATTIRVVLPQHLRTLARVEEREVRLEVEGEEGKEGKVTQRAVLDALEDRYPMLRGTVRHHDSGKRRAFVRFFACQNDLSHDSPDDPLPEAVTAGSEPFMIVGAMAGG